ncbi:hypothetical protein AB0N09_33235 [Streptomyces erythrochromogenes]|uniref:hypothetical protein n=1 Tax=Streptomyces erythrochromogenes TaxID=285574 RepID=UPI003418BFB9
MTVPLKDAVDLYMQAAGQTSAGAVSLRRSVLLRLVRRFPDHDFKDMSTRDVAQFLYGVHGIAEGKRASTVASYRSCLKAFFSYGLRMNWSSTPVVVIRPPDASEQLFRLKMGLHQPLRGGGRPPPERRTWADGHAG